MFRVIWQEESGRLCNHKRDAYLSDKGHWVLVTTPDWDPMGRSGHLKVVRQVATCVECIHCVRCVRCNALPYDREDRISRGQDPCSAPKETRRAKCSSCIYS
jgi:hypothetical protein